MLLNTLRAGLAAALITTTLPALAATPDYQREREWASDIRAEVAEGEAIDLTTSLTPYPFLTLFSPGDRHRAVILAHDLGLHPDSGLIRTLRQALHEHGYTTLSLQMPILGPLDDAYGYRDLIPEGASRISRAVSFLENQGYDKILLLGHGLGARMLNTYLTKPSAYVRGAAALGNTDPAYSPAKFPVLDLYGEADEEFVRSRAKSRAKSFKNKASKQVKIAGAGHFYEDHEDAVIKALVQFYDKTVGKPVPPKVEAPVKPAAAPAATPPAQP